MILANDDSLTMIFNSLTMIFYSNDDFFTGWKIIDLSNHRQRDEKSSEQGSSLEIIVSEKDL